MVRDEDMAVPLTTFVSTLTSLAEQLGLSADQLASVEDAQALDFRFTVLGSAVALLTVERLATVAAHCGHAAHVELLSDDLPELLLTDPIDASRLQTLQRRAKQPGISYGLLIRVDKTRLVADLSTNHTAPQIRLFLFASGLRRTLARGVTRIEQDLWPDGATPLAILVVDTEISLKGPHLALLGGKALSELPIVQFQSSGDLKDVREARDRNIGWDTPWVQRLTPWHFDVAGSCVDPDLRGLIRAQLVKLTILFTCDRARRRDGGEIRAEYRGQDHLAVIPIDERHGVSVTGQQAADLLRLVSWCYRRDAVEQRGEWVSDRLPFVQTRLAELLEPVPENRRLSELISTIPAVLEGIDWYWKSFIEGKVATYLDRVQQVERLVGDTVSSFADRTAALVKSLTDAILAAVAVLIGSFIAAGFQHPFNAVLFRIGVLVYAGYVLLFPGLFSMISNGNGLAVLTEEYQSRLGRLKELVLPGKLDEIVGERITRAQKRYWRWVAVVALLYVVIAVAAVVAAIVLPGAIQAHPGATS